MKNSIRTRTVPDGIELYTAPFSSGSLLAAELIAHIAFKNNGWVIKFRQNYVVGWISRPDFVILQNASRQLLIEAQTHLERLKTAKPKRKKSDAKKANVRKRRAHA